MMSLLKFKTYDFTHNLAAPNKISLKIDGIQCVCTEDGWRSKRGEDSLHALNNIQLDAKVGDIFEYYAGSWEESCKIRCKDFVPNKEDFYKLIPTLDKRLVYGEYNFDLSNNTVEALLKSVCSLGYEGLVIVSNDTYFKVKPFVSYDVVILDIYEGEAASRKGKLGGVITECGKVSSGWSDEEREKYFKDPSLIIGKTIEVKSMGKTKDNKFRHPSKLRIRWDK